MRVVDWSTLTSVLDRFLEKGSIMHQLDTAEAVFAEHQEHIVMP